MFITSEAVMHGSLEEWGSSYELTWKGPQEIALSKRKG